MLHLYITGGTPHSEQALQRLRVALKGLPEHRYDLHIVDLRNEPLRALQDGIVAVPTLQLSTGTSRSRLIGDLSESERLDNFLNIFS
jgi:hypothetical protein